MTKKIQRLLQITFFAIVGSLLLINCEPDVDNLGAQFFENGAARDSVVLSDLIAYNISNNDSIRADNSKLDSATIGAFNVPEFGLQKSSYYTQIRLSTYAPDFGANPVVDSIIMVIKPRYAADSITTSTNATYNYPDGNIASTKVVNTYPIIYKYGRTKIGGETKLTLNVNEVTDFMGSSVDKLFSNKSFATGELIGTKIFNGNLSSVNIKKNSDNSELYNRDPAIRIPLDSAFFQNKIIAKNGKSELSDVSTFIRYFKGLKLSVAENDGYIFKFNPNLIDVIMYYKNDLVTNGTTTRQQISFQFDVGSQNTHLQNIAFDRAGTSVAAALASSNGITGDSKLYPQGMGGPSIGLKIPEATIVSLKDLYTNQKVGILSAKIRLYSDSSVANKFPKPNFFTVQQKDVSTFLTEFSVYTTNPNYNLVTVKDLFSNPTYYDIDLTKTIKNTIETEAPNKDIVLNVGQYTLSAQGGYVGSTSNLVGYAQNFNTRSYTPNAVVLVGTDPSNAQRAQLRIIYAKK